MLLIFRRCTSSFLQLIGRFQDATLFICKLQTWIYFFHDFELLSRYKRLNSLMTQQVIIGITFCVGILLLHLIYIWRVILWLTNIFIILFYLSWFTAEDFSWLVLGHSNLIEWTAWLVLVNGLVSILILQVIVGLCGWHLECVSINTVCDLLLFEFSILVSGRSSLITFWFLPVLHFWLLNWLNRIVCLWLLGLRNFAFIRYHQFDVLKPIESVMIRLIVFALAMRQLLVFWCWLWLWRLHRRIGVQDLLALFLHALRWLIECNLRFRLELVMLQVLRICITIIERDIRLSVRLQIEIINLWS